MENEKLYELYESELVKTKNKILLSNNTLSKNEIKALIKDEFYHNYPEAKQAVVNYTKSIRHNKGPGSVVGKRLCIVIFKKVFSNIKTTTLSNTFYEKYEKLVLDNILIPDDYIISFIGDVSRGAPSNCRSKLKEKGYGFKRIKLEDQYFWKVVTVPDNTMDQFITSLSKDQKKMFKKLLGESDT